MSGISAKTYRDEEGFPPLILVVDDEEIDRHTISGILESGERFRVLTAGDFNEAVKVFEDHHGEWALALLDVTLPGKNGVELAKHLLVLNPDLKVLFISGHVGASVIHFYGIDAPDRHFLQKPFDGPTLLGRVEAALQDTEPLYVMLPTGETSAGE